MLFCVLISIRIQQGVKKCIIFYVLQQPNFVLLSSKSFKTKFIAFINLENCPPEVRYFKILLSSNNSIFWLLTPWCRKIKLFIYHPDKKNSKLHPSISNVVIKNINNLILHE